MSEIEVRWVQAPELSEVWGQVQPFIAAALEYAGGRQTEKTIADALLKRTMQLWTVSDNGTVLSAFVSHLINYPTGLRACNVVVLGGVAYKKWLDQARIVIREWAKSEGCHKIEMTGRPGWEKILKDWNKLTVMLEEDLYKGEEL